MPRSSAREQLIEAGLQTLHLHGFNGCGVRDITDAAGVPKGSFYNHLESKEALALQTLERFWQKGTGWRALLSDTNVDPVERLRRHFRALADAVVAKIFKEAV
jgi:TetR/AcrR family transcriptional regulator, transcriptional repressor for nem operon